MCVSVKINTEPFHTFLASDVYLCTEKQFKICVRVTTKFHNTFPENKINYGRQHTIIPFKLYVLLEHTVSTAFTYTYFSVAWNISWIKWKWLEQNKSNSMRMNDREIKQSMVQNKLECFWFSSKSRVEVGRKPARMKQTNLGIMKNKNNTLYQIFSRFI